MTLCFGQLVVATAQGFQRGEDVQELFGSLVFAKYLDDVLVNARSFVLGKRFCSVTRFARLTPTNSCVSASSKT